MTGITERHVDCYSGGVKAIIEELHAEAVKLIPETVLFTASYQNPDKTSHVQYDEYKIRETTAEPNPNTHSIYFEASTERLIIHIHVSYERLTGRQGGFVNGGISFQEVVERKYDLLWVKKIPTDFGVLGLHDGAVLVTRESTNRFRKV